jgi:hypothetical protein
VRPTAGPPDDPSALAAIGEGIPDRPDAAVPLLLAVDRLSSFALHRAAVEDLLDAVERAGVDPLVALDRLTADPDLDPAVDLDRRRAQVEQLRS